MLIQGLEISRQHTVGLDLILKLLFDESLTIEGGLEYGDIYE